MGTTDPWTSIKSQDLSKQQIFKKKTKKKQSRIERAFSQQEGESSQESSQTMTVGESSCNSQEFSSFQDLSDNEQSQLFPSSCTAQNFRVSAAAQCQHFQSFQFQNPLMQEEYSYFHNAHICDQPFIQEQEFSTSFLGPIFR